MADRLPIALEAMGGDHAPHEIVQGAIQARDELGIDVVLVGRAAEIGDAGGLPVIEASEVIDMDDRRIDKLLFKQVVNKEDEAEAVAAHLDH